MRNIHTDVKLNVGPDDEEITLSVHGSFSRHGSYNPRERGAQLDGWNIEGVYNESGHPIVAPILTQNDRLYIERKLYEEMLA